MRAMPLRVGASALIALATPVAAEETAKRAPYAALLSASAALKVVVDEVCAPAVINGGSIEVLAKARHMQPVDPRRAGSAMATRAWRLASLGDVHVFELPNGGCSASVERGDPEVLHREALGYLTARRPDLALGQSQPADNGRAHREAYCSTEPRPIVAALLKKVGRSRRPAFLLNLFRAEAARPAFCSPNS